MPSAVDRYREMSLDLFPAEEIRKLNNESINDAGRDSFSKHISERFLPLDLKIVCTMLDEGYTLKETTETLNQYSLFASAAKEVCTLADFRHYADSVMAHVHEIRERKVGEKYELAKKFYLSRSNNKKLNEAQEGGIVLSMLAGGFSADVVKKVILENSVSLKGNATLAHNMIDACLQIRHFYNTLERTIPSASIYRGSLSAYKYFASEYLRKNKRSVLDIQGDQIIARQMIEAGLDKDFIFKSLRHSPLAAEPWRDKNRYISAILSKVEAAIKQQKYADDRYRLTASMYDDKISRVLKAIEQKTKNHDIVASRTYCDGIVARELLEEHQLRTNVERVIAKKSPEAKKDFSDKALSYGKAIVMAAFAVLRAENRLLKGSLPSIPRDATFTELKSRGITSGDLYKDVVHRRILDYPSIAGMLTAPFIDRDAAENLMIRYPDMPQKDLEKAICENSPRAKMSGISDDYPAAVIESVNARKALLLQREQQESKFDKEMKDHVQVEQNALLAGSPAWNLTLCSGLVAIRMLQEGYSDRDVLPALIQPPDVREQDAIHIISGAENVLSRIDYIQQYSPVSDSVREQLESKALASDEYMRLYQSSQVDKDKLMSDLDVEIAKNMLLKGYKRDEIQEIIQSNSPVSVEPGRNADYSSYITEQAALEIEKEKERMKLYKPMPRNEHEEDAEKEYEYHLRNMRAFSYLPHESYMDSLIAEAMLVQGFQVEAIGAAIEKLSPVAGDEGYGMGIVRSLEVNSAVIAAESPVLVRAIEGVG